MGSDQFSQTTACRKIGRLFLKKINVLFDITEAVIVMRRELSPTQAQDLANKLAEPAPAVFVTPAIY